MNYVGEEVIAVFDNLLPDNEQIRRRLAARMHADGVDAYSLLATIGRDCIGALQFLPDNVDPSPVGDVNADVVTAARIAEILSDLEGAPLGGRFLHPNLKL